MISAYLSGPGHEDAKHGVHAGSMHGSQLSMQTTLDLVLLLLDDIDAGQAISPERTQQLRAILLNDDGVITHSKRLRMRRKVLPQ